MQKSESKYLSDELGATITTKWVFSIAPVPVAAERTSPYNCMNHSKTAMQLRLSEVGGERVVFNLTWPQFDTLKRAVNKAQENITMERRKEMKPFFWELQDAAGDDNFVRIFGAPDRDGLSQVRKLVIRRQPLRQGKTVNWNGQIPHGILRFRPEREGKYRIRPEDSIWIQKVMWK